MLIPRPFLRRFRSFVKLSAQSSQIAEVIQLANEGSLFRYSHQGILVRADLCVPQICGLTFGPPVPQNMTIRRGFLER